MLEIKKIRGTKKIRNKETNMGGILKMSKTNMNIRREEALLGERMVNFIKLAVFCYIGKHSKTLAFS